MYDLPFLLVSHIVRRLKCHQLLVRLGREVLVLVGCNYQTLCLSFPSRTSEPLVGFAIINYRTSSNKRPGAYLKISAKRRTAYWKEGASSRGRLFSWKLVEIQKNGRYLHHFR